VLVSRQHGADDALPGSLQLCIKLFPAGWRHRRPAPTRQLCRDEILTCRDGMLHSCCERALNTRSQQEWHCLAE
jgi:hypothetical protein